MQKDAGRIDHRRIGGIGADAERVENFAFEHRDGPGEGLLGHLAGADAVSEPVDDGAACLHDRSMAVFVDGGPQSRKVEQAMNRWDMSIVGCHGAYSNPKGAIDGVD